MNIFKLSTGAIGNAIRIIGTLALITSEVVVPCIKKKVVKEYTSSKTSVGYDDVIGAVMNTNMLSDYKVKIVAIIPKNKNEELYKAIIQILQSDMLSSHIFKSIECICTE